MEEAQRSYPEAQQKSFLARGAQGNFLQKTEWDQLRDRVGQSPPTGVLPGLDRDTDKRLKSPQVAWRVCSKEGREKGQRWGCRHCRGLEAHAKELDLDPLEQGSPTSGIYWPGGLRWS